MENASKALIIAGAILISILLISIGIILINSGKDVTSTGTSQMNSQKIQTFNSQFTPYEGTKKGSEIKSLINVVNASNASDSEHQVTVEVPKAYNVNIKTAGDFIDSKTYIVSIYYYQQPMSTYYGTKYIVGKALYANGKWYTVSEPGYIDRILIRPSGSLQILPP